MNWLDYALNLVIFVSLYQILCHSLRFHLGLGRLFNLAHVAVYGIGAYTTALLEVNYQIGFFPALGASMAVCGVFSLLLGAISLRLSEEYFAIGTIAFSAIVLSLLVNWKSLTRGVLGIPGIPRPRLGGGELIENEPFTVLVVCVAGAVLFLLYWLAQSKLARDLAAQAENEWAALALGKNTVRARNTSFVLSSIFAGAAGSLYSYYITFIDPSSFQLPEMIFLLSAVVLGGPHSFWGVTGSTVFLVLLPEALRFVALDPGILGPMRQLIYGALLFVVVYLRGESLFPAERRV